MANPTTNYGFVLPTASDLVTDLPADFDVALQGVDTRLKALQPGTTLGDLAYSSATANTNTRLAIGTTGQVLTVSGGVPSWAAASSPTVGCALFAQALAFAYTTNTDVVIPFASETFDTDSFHSTSSNTSRITIPTGKGGNYRISAEFFLTGVGSTYAILKIYKNGAQISAEGILQGQFVRYASGGNTAVLNGSVILPLVAGDYLELFYLADSATGTHTSYAQFNAILLP